MQLEKKIKQNHSSRLENYLDLKATLGNRWVHHNTAILVIHGIGHQNPLETLDGFSRGLIKTLNTASYDLKIEHRVAKKTSSNSSVPWFDNYLRVYPKDNGGAYIDIYEYYWAPETEGHATFKDLNIWLSNVTKGARQFYSKNVDFATSNNDSSIFINKGKFRPFIYWVCISLVPQIIVFINWLLDLIIKLLLAIPVIGSLSGLLVKNRLDGTFERLSNVLNDISIYNTVDAKSKFFKIRTCILDGAVNALKYLLETGKDVGNNSFSFKYEKILLTGHSLGSQIAFDAINRINHLVNQGEVNGYNNDGRTAFSNTNNYHPSIDKRLIGLLTFGSPLDKIAFFFREQVSDKEYLRSQILHDFHGFKQRDWLNIEKFDVKIEPCNKRFFENVPWYNYWDRKDYVSGPLDYYKDVRNIDCGFDSYWHSFTHSRYWECDNMYADVLKNLLISDEKAPSTEEPSTTISSSHL